MTFSDDPSSPAAPFSGDGSVFDLPDVLLQSPTTTERVVDTQSGFLVVVKRLGDRLGISFKRRVGTPPTSQVLLSPDESIKLSRILSTTLMGVEEPYFEDEIVSADADLGAQRRPTPAFRPERKVLNKVLLAQIAGAVVLLGFVFGLIGFVAGNSLGESKAPAAAVVDPLESDKIDAFARKFVAYMLDFNPDSYKTSQVQAMSFMAPELLEKYWKETNFPLSRTQLKNLPQGTTVMIERIGKERIAPDSATADIYAQLVHSDSKISNPVHLKLKLGLDTENGIQVLEQEDLTAAVH
jgi:hypothetical protein